MKAMRQARLELMGGSTPAPLHHARRPPSCRVPPCAAPSPSLCPAQVPILQSIAVAERALTSPSATLDGAGTTPHFMYVSPTKAVAQD